MITEQEFIARLSTKLSFLAMEDRIEIIESYQAQFSEMRAEGMSDSQIIASIENIDTIVENIKKEFNVSKQSEYQAKAKQSYASFKDSFSKNVNVKHNSSFNSKVSGGVRKILEVIYAFIQIMFYIVSSLIIVLTILTMPFVFYFISTSYIIVLFYIVLYVFEISGIALCNRFIKYLGGKL